MIESLRESLLEHKLFRCLSEPQLEQLLALSKEITLEDGAKIFSEGEKSYDFYLVQEGHLAIFKKSDDGTPHRIGTKKVGDCVGELAFIKPGSRSATLQAEGICKLIKINGEKIRTHHEYIDLYAALSVEMGKLVSEDLRYTNDVTVKSMQAELASTKLLLAAGRFMVGVVFIISAYIFVLGLLPILEKHFVDTTPVSIGLLIFFAGASLIVVYRSGFPLKNYGLTFDNSLSNIVEAVLFSIPMMLLFVLIKWIAVSTVPAWSNESVFQPFAVLNAKHAPLIAYFWVPFAYAIFCPLQEFIARGLLQTSFHMFLSKNTWQSVWFAILLTNLLFASTHMHTSFGFAMIAFFPGLFWGWLFFRQQSLVGVSVSHIIIGVWAVFFVSFENLV